MHIRTCAIGLLLLAASTCAAQTPGASPSDTAQAQNPIYPFQQPPTVASPPDFPRGKISGQMFGDVYYNVSGDPRHDYTAAGSDNGQVNIDGAKPITRDLNGMQVRRVYFQLDNDLSVRYATRFRLEVDGKSLTTDGKLGVFVKGASFQAKSLIPRGNFFAGMLTTPTYETSEEFWQYRAIEKTIADFRGLASSADLGVELKGFVDGEHHVGYAAMIGDGTGQKPESDRFKRLYLVAPLKLGDLRLEPYFDYQGVRVNLLPKVASHTDSLAVNNDQAMWKAFAGYELRRAAVGVEVVGRVNHKAGVPNTEPRGVSVFARGTLLPALAAFARFDHWQPDRRVANRVDSQLWIAGLDWQPIPDVHFMPNVEVLHYLAKGTAVVPAHDDVQARVTFYYKFSKPQS